MTTNATRRQRVSDRRCVDCAAGLQDEDGVRCVECADRQRESLVRYRQTDKGRTANRRILKKRRDARRAAGQCVDCPSPALPGASRCEPHRARNALNRQLALIRREAA